ncbi:MAG TPA: MlaD family protein [Aeromicrobium sp.]|nr:MlaD family protein [Aeromicrobium sp.]
MTRGVRIRLISFVALAALGIFYIAASYLGVVDAALGRGKQVTVALPTSGGLYIGSEVDYRGVKIGKVGDMRVTPSGVDVVLQLEDVAEVPRDSDVYVSNLSAVGEQYLNFVPRSSGGGPHLEDGDRVMGSAESLPPSTDKLLTSLDSFVNSVDPDDLQTVVTELGTMFRGNAENLRILIDSGTQFVDEATAHEDATIALLNDGGKVLAVQQDESDSIRSFARGLVKVTKTLKGSDSDLRDIFSEGAKTGKELKKLLDELRPVLSPFLANFIELNQVINPRLAGIGEIFAVLPTTIKNGLFYGTPGDGYGHVTMTYDYTKPPCTMGYLPPSQWPSPHDVREHPLYPARCSDPRAQTNYTGNDPINQRGVNFAPKIDDSAPIYTQNPYRRYSSSSASGTRAATSGPTGLAPVVGQAGWEGMFTGE